MSSESGMPQHPEFDFDAIEAAVKETERGRWFLAEYDRRGRASETRALLQAIAKLERILGSSNPAAAGETSSPPSAPATQTDGLRPLALEAQTIAAELAQLCDVAETNANSLHDNPEGMAGAVLHLAQRLAQLAALQDALARGILEAGDHAQSGGSGELFKVAAELQRFATDAPRMAQACGEESLKYFAEDEEIFSREAAQATLPPVAPASAAAGAADAQKPLQESAEARIVIVRTPSSQTTAIPLAESAPDQPQSAA